MATYHDAIRDALTSGYRVILETGQIIGLKGEPLGIRLHGSQRYPSVSLVTPNMPNRFYAVPAHKVIAYAAWGDAAFESCVRHLNDNTCDIRIVNLALGTHSENEHDKPSHVRQRSARAARAAQPVRSYNTKVTAKDVIAIRAETDKHRNHNGRIRRGVVKRLAEHYGVASSTISSIAHRHHGMEND